MTVVRVPPVTMAHESNRAVAAVGAADVLAALTDDSDDSYIEPSPAWTPYPGSGTDNSRSVLGGNWGPVTLPAGTITRARVVVRAERTDAEGSLSVVASKHRAQGFQPKMTTDGSLTGPGITNIYSANAVSDPAWNEATFRAELVAGNAGTSPTWGPTRAELVFGFHNPYGEPYITSGRVYGMWLEVTLDEEWRTPKTGLTVYFTNSFGVGMIKDGATTWVQEPDHFGYSVCVLGDGRVLTTGFGDGFTSNAKVYAADLTGGVNWNDHGGGYEYVCAADGLSYYVDTGDASCGVCYDPVTDNVFLAADAYQAPAYELVFTLTRWSTAGELLEVMVPYGDGVSGNNRWVSGSQARGISIDPPRRRIAYHGTGDFYGVVLYDIDTGEATSHRYAFRQALNGETATAEMLHRYHGISGAVDIALDPVTGRLVAYYGKKLEPSVEQVGYPVYTNDRRGYLTAYRVDDIPSLDSRWYEQIDQTWVATDDNIDGWDAPYTHDDDDEGALFVLPGGAVYAASGYGRDMITPDPEISGLVEGLWYLDFATLESSPIPFSHEFLTTYYPGWFDDIHVLDAGCGALHLKRPDGTLYGVGCGCADTGRLHVMGPAGLHAETPSGGRPLYLMLPDGTVCQVACMVDPL